MLEKNITADERMTKGEREHLQRLLRQREKVQKSAAKARSTELLADFENQIAAQYRFDDDEVWAAAVKAAEKLVGAIAFDHSGNGGLLSRATIRAADELRVILLRYHARRSA